MQNDQKNKKVLILILGSMTALSPFAIDMYLPAFQSIATDFNATIAQISLSLSSYFIGLAGGQLIYGPLLDRFGRKRPLYVGLLIFIISALFCLFSETTTSLITWRFFQAIGGCAAGVASMTMVRDHFTVKESAKVYSLLILILGASPLLAPTIGGYLASAFGWHSIFMVLAVMGLVLLLAVKFFLQESHAPDPTVILKAGPIFRNFILVLKEPQFYTYAFSGAIAFSGLFVYLAGSPIIFLNNFGVSSQVYGWIFAIVAAGLIGASQFNVLLLRSFTNQQLVLAAMCAQVLIAVVFLIGTNLGLFGLSGTVLMFFLFLCCFGLTNPNAGALALAPFSKNTGSAAAMLGFLQMGVGALASAMIGIFDIESLLPIVAIMAGSSSAALVILLVGRFKLSKTRLSLAENFSV